MSEKENDRVVLELPRCITGVERLGSSVAARFSWVNFYQAPSHLSDSDTVHVLEATGNLVIPRELFDRCEVGLKWDRLGDLPHRGFIVHWADNELALAAEPAAGHTGDVPYTPESRTAHGAMQRRGNLTPEEWQRLNRPTRRVGGR